MAVLSDPGACREARCRIVYLWPTGGVVERVAGEPPPSLLSGSGPRGDQLRRESEALGETWPLGPSWLAGQPAAHARACASHVASQAFWCEGGWVRGPMATVPLALLVLCARSVPQCATGPRALLLM